MGCFLWILGAFKYFSQNPQSTLKSSVFILDKVNEHRMASLVGKASHSPNFKTGLYSPLANYMQSTTRMQPPALITHQKHFNLKLTISHFLLFSQFLTYIKTHFWQQCSFLCCPLTPPLPKHRLLFLPTLLLLLFNIHQIMSCFLLCLLL